MTSYQCSTVLLSCIVSEINGDFSRKSQILPTPCILGPRQKGFSLEFAIGARGEKTTVMGLPGRERSLTISAVWIQCTNVTDGRTDGHRTTAKTALTHSVSQSVSQSGMRSLCGCSDCRPLQTILCQRKCIGQRYASVRRDVIKPGSSSTST